jgi:hypothetical protein
MSLLPLTLAQALRESCTELRPLDSEKPRTFRVAAPCPPFRTATVFEIKHDGFRFISAWYRKDAIEIRQGIQLISGRLSCGVPFCDPARQP